jgi:hypothetical protein
MLNLHEVYYVDALKKLHSIMVTPRVFVLYSWAILLIVASTQKAMKEDARLEGSNRSLSDVPHKCVRENKKNN